MKRTLCFKIVSLLVAVSFLTTTAPIDRSFAEEAFPQRTRKEEPPSQDSIQNIFAPDSVSWESQTKFFLIPPQKENRVDHLRPQPMREAKDGGSRLEKLKKELLGSPSGEPMSPSRMTRREWGKTVALLTGMVAISTGAIPSLAIPPSFSATPPLSDQSAKVTEVELPKLVDAAYHQNSLEWVTSQKIRGNAVGGFNFDGLYQGYAPNDHPYSRYIAEYGRVWTYDQALGIFSDLKNGRVRSAKEAVDALVAIAKAEEKKGFKGLWHFSYNTAGDNFIDPRGPLGANLWAVNAIYAYILQTGDTRHLVWLNEKVKTFIFGQQVMDLRDPRYGLFRGGLYNAIDLAKGSAMGYSVYVGTLNVQNENVFIEHNADAAGTLRLAFHAAKKFGVADATFKQGLIRRHELLMKGLQKFWVGDHFVTGMRADGTLNRSIAVDNESWVGAAILPYDQEKAWQAIQYLKRHFTVTLTEVESLSGSFESPRRTTKKLPQPATGLFFFSGDFHDPYVPQNPKYEEMIQPEATLGTIAFLKSFIETTKDPERKKEAAEFLTLLYDGVLKVYRAYGGKGTPYATLNIPDYFNNMEGMAGTATASTVMAVLKGARGDDFIYWAPPEEFVVNGKAPSVLMPQTIKVKMGERTSTPPREEKPGTPRPQEKQSHSESAKGGGIGIQVQKFSPSSMTLKINGSPEVLKNSLVLALIRTDAWYIQPYAESTFPIGANGTVVIRNFRGNFKRGNTLILVVDRRKWERAKTDLRGDKSYMADWEMKNEGPIKEAILAKSAQDGGRKRFTKTIIKGALATLIVGGIGAGIAFHEFATDQTFREWPGITDYDVYGVPLPSGPSDIVRHLRFVNGSESPRPKDRFYATGSEFQEALRYYRALKDGPVRPLAIEDLKAILFAREALSDKVRFFRESGEKHHVPPTLLAAWALHNLMFKARRPLYNLDNDLLQVNEDTGLEGVEGFKREDFEVGVRYHQPGWIKTFSRVVPKEIKKRVRLQDRVSDYMGGVLAGFPGTMGLMQIRASRVLHENLWNPWPSDVPREGPAEEVYRGINRKLLDPRWNIEAFAARWEQHIQKGKALQHDNAVTNVPPLDSLVDGWLNTHYDPLAGAYGPDPLAAEFDPPLESPAQRSNDLAYWSLSAISTDGVLAIAEYLMPRLHILAHESGLFDSPHQQIPGIFVGITKVEEVNELARLAGGSDGYVRDAALRSLLTLQEAPQSDLQVAAQEALERYVRRHGHPTQSLTREAERYRTLQGTLEPREIPRDRQIPQDALKHGNPAQNLTREVLKRHGQPTRQTQRYRQRGGLSARDGGVMKTEEIDPNVSIFDPQNNLSIDAAAEKRSVPIGINAVVLKEEVTLRGFEAAVSQLYQTDKMTPKIYLIGNSETVGKSLYDALRVLQDLYEPLIEVVSPSEYKTIKTRYEKIAEVGFDPAETPKEGSILSGIGLLRLGLLKDPATTKDLAPEVKAALEALAHSELHIPLAVPRQELLRLYDSMV